MQSVGRDAGPGKDPESKLRFAVFLGEARAYNENTLIAAAKDSGKWAKK
jgi:hypothetical protein